MKPVLVDTDVFSFAFKGDSRAVELDVALANKQLCLSFMTVAELFRWAIARNWGEKRRNSLHAAIAHCPTIPYDPPTALAWARISVERKRIGRPIECGDCWIAACAIRHRMPLVTHNTSDFEHIAGLELLTTSR